MVIPAVSLQGAVRQQLERLCDAALSEVLAILGKDLSLVVGVGRYAEKKARKAVGSAELDGIVCVTWIMHPSPRNPMTNFDNWKVQFEKNLDEVGFFGLFPSQCL
jgi:hypothetical protein